MWAEGPYLFAFANLGRPPFFELRSLLIAVCNSIDLATHVISTPFFSYELISSPIC